EDTVSAARLDELHAFCPCALHESQEELTKLAGMLFVQGQFFDQNSLVRRRTLQMLLFLSDSLAAEGMNLGIEQFRGCTYSGGLPEKKEWDLPERLQVTRQQWAIYQRNEILSLAVQGIFYVILGQYGSSGERFQSVDELVLWFLERPEVEGVASFFPLDSPVGHAKREADSWLPPLDDWGNDSHEIQLAFQIETLCRDKHAHDKHAAILLACLKALVALQCRHEIGDGYGDFVFPPNYLQAYPINLQTFNHHSSNTWDTLSMREWIGWLAKSWGINTHFMVALRKLRGQSQSTFRIRPSDQGLEMVEAPQAVFTTPRFRQAVRILKDIGALVRTGEVWAPSELGKRFMEMADE
ncbi:MAG: hypothetical protein KJ717_13955, partial [Proteobacteria bacterium]|nr:hypothetical protein [Pseudomonadota bacterium]